MSANFFDPPRRRDALRFRIMIDNVEHCDYQGRVLHLETQQEYPFDGVLDLLETVQFLLNERNRLPATHRMRGWENKQKA